MSVKAIADVLRHHRFNYSSERQLQDGIEAALTAAGFEVEREVRLEGLGRIDLLVGRVGIDVKVAGAPFDVASQVGALMRRYRRALKAAKIDSHRFHDLRYTFGTVMAAAGVPMRTSQEWMGYRDIATTQLRRLRAQRA